MKLNEMLGACVEGRFDLAQLPAALLPAAVPPCPGSGVEQGPQPRRARSPVSFVGRSVPWWGPRGTCGKQEVVSAWPGAASQH